MKWRRFISHTFLFFGGVWYAVWSFVRRPFPMLDENPLLDLMDYHTPNFYGWVMVWYYVSPFVAVMLGGLILLSVWKVWLEARRRDFAPFGALPAWPLSDRQNGSGNRHRRGPSSGRSAGGFQPRMAHHPGAAASIPEWRSSVPSGPARLRLACTPSPGSFSAGKPENPQMRAAALVLEVKGDFCHDIRRILTEAGRAKDYIELGMNGRWQWNPLSAWWLDSYSLAYTVSSLLNQLFGKGKEPFWQQALY